MTALERHLQDYLAIRRGLGFKLGNEQRALRRFVEFMDDVGEPTVTIELALRWAILPAGGQTTRPRHRQLPHRARG